MGGAILFNREGRRCLLLAIFLWFKLIVPQ
jgi:hypothetical protein